MLALAAASAALAAPLAQDALLDRVVANDTRYHAALPSITARESIECDLSQHGLYRARARAEASLRVSQADGGATLMETRTFLTLNGKSIADGKHVVLPFDLLGGFSSIADTFFGKRRLSCYVFTRTNEPGPNGWVQFSFNTAARATASCEEPGAAVAGLVQIDPDTAELRHIERRTTSPAAEGSHSLTFLAVDYAPAKIGDETFCLPTSLRAELDHGKGHFAAQYSGYHRFTGTVTIVPAAGEPKDQ